MENSNNKNTEKGDGIVVKFLKNTAIYLLISFSIILSGIAIFFSLEPITIQATECSIILSFVGIIATFIVVGNYAQVMTIRSDFKKQVEKIENNFKEEISTQEKKHNITITKVESLIKDNEKIKNDNNILEGKISGALLHIQGNLFYTSRNYKSAYKCYLESAILYNLTSDNENLHMILSQIIKIVRLLSIEDINKINSEKNHNINQILSSIKDVTSNDIIEEIRKTIYTKEPKS